MRLYRSYGAHYRWTVRLSAVGVEIEKDRLTRPLGTVHEQWRPCELLIAPWPWRRGF